ncbi:MAG: NTP transferase domain-containing protein [Gemmatimonadaceae bacterium]|nr:NTP transferase domain-containing protein [Gemmatimonadaceae bacterium]
MSRWAVVLAGGIGSRFWPLSTPARPKQLLPLLTEKPLLRETVDRLLPLVDPGHILILTNASLVEPISAALPDVPRANLIAEPKPAGTAAALTWAALEISRRDGDSAVMISVHADWAIPDAAGFRKVLGVAESVALDNSALVTVGVRPTRPETGFGYIEPEGDASAGVKVRRFIEKPDASRARELVAAGNLWNSGIFVWRVGDFLSEVQALTPEISPALAGAPRTDREKFFSSVRSISVDHGVLERSKRVMVAAGEFGWDDIGTWPALARSRALDASGNAANGKVHLVDSSNNVVHSEHGTVVMYGVSDLVVVVRDGMTLVTTAEKAADLKTLVDSLPQEIKDA